MSEQCEETTPEATTETEEASPEVVAESATALEATEPAATESLDEQADASPEAETGQELLEAEKAPTDGGAAPCAEEPGEPELPLPSPGDLVLLDVAVLEFREEAGALQMRDGAEGPWRPVRLVRLFPLSDARRWVSVQNPENKEIGVIEDLHGLSKEALHHVETELDRRYMAPEIERIVSVRSRFDMVEWTVETDRGRVAFITRNLREQVQRPSTSYLIFTDVEGRRYDIPDLEALDPPSRRLLEERL